MIVDIICVWNFVRNNEIGRVVTLVTHIFQKYPPEGFDWFTIKIRVTLGITINITPIICRLCSLFIFRKLVIARVPVPGIFSFTSVGKIGSGVL